MRLSESLKKQSLFLRLVISFISIILLLVPFMLFSFNFYRDHIRDEMIKYNNLTLTNTTNEYEKQFKMINDSVLGFSFNDRVSQQVSSPSTDYFSAYKLMAEIQNFLSTNSSNLYLDNVILYYQNTSFALEKSRGADADVLFNKFFHSKQYPYDFWAKQFTENYRFRIFPPAAFTDSNNQDELNSSKSSVFFPIVVKNNLYPNFYILALTDADRMYQKFHISVNDNFYILDQQLNNMYASEQSIHIEMPQFDPSAGYVMQNNFYYFYQKGTYTGFTYVNIIPDEIILSQTRLNFTLIALLILSLIISALASLFFSVKINQPVKKLVNAMQQLSTSSLPLSRIKEFSIIGEKIGNMIQTNEEIHRDLTNKTSLLRYYAYTNKLKKIDNHVAELKELSSIDKPFIFVLFQLSFKPEFRQEFIMDEDRATFFIKEYINHVIKERHAGAHTFQVEQDKILSIILCHEQELDLSKTLDEIKQVISMDSTYCFLTVAVGSQQTQSSAFDSAYEQVLHLIGLRKFNDETQIIWNDAAKISHFLLAPTQEEELDIHLKQANETTVCEIITRTLAQMERKGAGVNQVLQFADSVIARMKKTLMFLNLSHDSLNELQNEMRMCNTYKELETLLLHAAKITVQLITAKAEKRDHITSFVFEYIEKHYAEEISLDILADKLNITRSYLSTYFKDSTGMYFNDYINQVRITMAKEFLTQQELKIQEIAAHVGYLNINSFNRIFKKLTGRTPSKYRQELQLKK